MNRTVLTLKATVAAFVVLGGTLVAADPASAAPPGRDREIIVGPATVGATAAGRICYRAHRKDISGGHWRHEVCDGKTARAGYRRRLDALEIWATGAGRLCADDAGNQVCAEPGHKVRIGDLGWTHLLYGGFKLSVEKGHICGSVRMYKRGQSPETCGKQIKLGDPERPVEGVILRLTT